MTDDCIINRKLENVVFTPVINYKPKYESLLRGFIYFLSQYYERFFTQKGKKLDSKFKKIFGYKYKGIDCETKSEEKQEGLLIQPVGHVEEWSDMLDYYDAESFFNFDFYNPVIPRRVMIGRNTDESINYLEQRVESIRQKEIGKLKEQGIEPILLSSSQISDNFLVLISKNRDFK